MWRPCDLAGPMLSASEIELARMLDEVAFKTRAFIAMPESVACLPLLFLAWIAALPETYALPVISSLECENPSVDLNSKADDAWICCWTDEPLGRESFSVDRLITSFVLLTYGWKFKALPTWALLLAAKFFVYSSALPPKWRVKPFLVRLKFLPLLCAEITGPALSCLTAALFLFN